MANGRRVKVEPFNWTGLGADIIGAASKFPLELMEAFELDKQVREGKANIEEGKQETREIAMAIVEDPKLRADAAKTFGVADDPKSVHEALLRHFKGSMSETDPAKYVMTAGKELDDFASRSETFSGNGASLAFLTQKARNASGTTKPYETITRMNKSHQLKQFNKEMSEAKDYGEYEKIKQKYGPEGFEVADTAEFKKAKHAKDTEDGLKFSSTYKYDLDNGNLAELKNIWTSEGGDEEGWDRMIEVYEQSKKYQDELARAEQIASKVERDKKIAELTAENKELEIVRKKQIIEKASKEALSEDDFDDKSLISINKKIETINNQIRQEQRAKNPNKENIKNLTQSLRAAEAVKKHIMSSEGPVSEREKEEVAGGDPVVFGGLIEAMNAGNVDWTDPRSIQKHIPEGWEVGPEKNGYITIFSTTADRAGDIKYISKNGEILDEIPQEKQTPQEQPTRGVPPIIPQGGSDIFGNTDRESDIAGALGL